LKEQEHIEEMTMYELKLYVVGRTPKSVEIIEELRKLLEDALDSHYHLHVIDVVESPQLAHKDKILATPTLEKVAPEPVRKIIGDLSDRETVLLALGLTAQQEKVIK
jgi:circadian clock protein KaiB